MIIVRIYFLNINISLIIICMRLKTYMLIVEMFLEGSLSQNIDLGLRFCFMVCGETEYKKDRKNSQKLSVSFGRK